MGRLSHLIDVERNLKRIKEEREKQEALQNDQVAIEEGRTEELTHEQKTQERIADTASKTDSMGGAEAAAAGMMMKRSPWGFAAMAGIKAGQKLKSGAGTVGRGVKTVATAPFRGASAGIGAIAENVPKPFWPPFMFLFFGSLDYFFNASFGHGDIAFVIDLILFVGALATYRHWIVLIPMFFEVVYPRYIALNFGWDNTLPIWAAFGLIAFIWEAKDIEWKPGSTATTMLTIMLVFFFFIGPNLGMNQLMASQVETGSVGKVSDFIKDRADMGTYRWSGVFGEVADCAIPNWMGGENNCTALGRRVDPSYAEAMQGKENKDIEPVEYAVDLKKNFDYEYYMDEDIALRAIFSITSQEYPIKGSFVYKIGETPTTALNVKLFETSYANGEYRYPESTILGTWPAGTIKEPGTYRAEFTAFFSIVTNTYYQTYFVKHTDENNLEFYYDTYDYLAKNRVPKAQFVGGPVIVKAFMGQVESPMEIYEGEDAREFHPLLVISIQDKNEGSRREKLKSISHILVKYEPWFSLSEGKACGDFNLNAERTAWVYDAAKLAIENRKLIERAKSPAIECQMEINEEALFAGNQLEPKEVTLSVQVSYEYEVKKWEDIEIIDPLAGLTVYSGEDYYCLEGIDFKQGDKGQADLIKEIRTRASAVKIPVMIALSVAQRESGINQYDSNGQTIKGAPNTCGPNNAAPCVDFGVMQINEYWHRTAFSALDMSCSYEQNIKYGTTILAGYKAACAYWERALNRYNAGSCYWAAEEPHDYKGTSPRLWPHALPSYSRAVEESCAQIGNILKDVSWTAQDCIDCIRTNSGDNCKPEIYPPPLA